MYLVLLIKQKVINFYTCDCWCCSYTSYTSYFCTWKVLITAQLIRNLLETG